MAILSWQSLTDNSSTLSESNNPGGTIGTVLTTSRVYERPLGTTELCLYWDSIFSRTTDIIQPSEVEVLSTTENPFTTENVLKTWTSMKQQFPLLAAKVESRGSQVFFVIEEQRLYSTPLTEVVFQNLASSEDVHTFVFDLMNSSSQLSNNLVSKLFIFSESNRSNFYHIVFLAAHYITDGFGSVAFLRTFLDRLSSTGPLPVWDINQRLALSVSSEVLIPQTKANLARRRWYRAIGQTLANIRLSSMRVSTCNLVLRDKSYADSPHPQGGHTLPRKVTKLTMITPARSHEISRLLSRERSMIIMRNCRTNGLTFGNVLPVLGQVAMTRVLCRRYIRGDINREEWDFRRKEPMITGGPINLRPFLDQRWLKQGGGENLSLVMGEFSCILPFMPLGSAFDLAPGDPLPSFDQLLSRGRFLLRCNLIKKQFNKQVKSPYFLEKTGAVMKARLHTESDRALKWLRRGTEQDNAKLLSVVEQAHIGLVTSNTGSSIGDVCSISLRRRNILMTYLLCQIDPFLPAEYPLNRERTSASALHLHAFRCNFRCRPTHLWLGAHSSRQQLLIMIYWDANVYEAELISEWLDEIREAIYFYLGQANIPLARL